MSTGMINQLFRMRAKKEEGGPNENPRHSNNVAEASCFGIKTAIWKKSKSKVVQKGKKWRRLGFRWQHENTNEPHF